MPSSTTPLHPTLAAMLAKTAHLPPISSVPVKARLCGMVANRRLSIQPMSVRAPCAL